MPKKRRVYISRIVGNQVMMPADLKRLHKYMREVEHISIVSDEMTRWSKSYGPSWHTSCRQRGREVELIPRPARCITGKLGAKESPGGEARAFKEKSCEYLGIKVP
jgi:hypothetical protein